MSPIVVLKMLMLSGVPVGDVLYLVAKNKGGFDDGVYKHESFFIGLALLSQSLAFFKWIVGPTLIFAGCCMVASY